MFILYLYIVFGEVSVKIFCHFLKNWSFLLFCFENPLYILILDFCQVCGLYIFLLVCSLFFILLTVFLRAEVLNFDEVQFIVFFTFMGHVFDVKSMLC